MAKKKAVKKTPVKKPTPKKKVTSPKKEAKKKTQKKSAKKKTSKKGPALPPELVNFMATYEIETKTLDNIGEFMTEFTWPTLVTFQLLSDVRKLLKK
jgi:hypothetical protein